MWFNSGYRPSCWGKHGGSSRDRQLDTLHPEAGHTEKCWCSASVLPFHSLWGGPQPVGWWRPLQSGSSCVVVPMRNVPYRLRYLNACLSAGGAALLEVHHWGWDLRSHSQSLLSVFSLSTSCLYLKSSQLTVMPPQPPRWPRIPLEPCRPK